MLCAFGKAWKIVFQKNLAHMAWIPTYKLGYLSG